MRRRDITEKVITSQTFLVIPSLIVVTETVILIEKIKPASAGSIASMLLFRDVASYDDALDLILGPQLGQPRPGPIRIERLEKFLVTLHH